jgi:hypothetical protein
MWCGYKINTTVYFLKKQTRFFRNKLIISSAANFGFGSIFMQIRVNSQVFTVSNEISFITGMDGKKR